MRIFGIVASFIAAIVLLVLIFGSWVTIDAGNRGVVLRMGAVTGEIMGEGFNSKAPFVTEVVEMEVRLQKEQVETEGASKDLQTVKAEIAANIRVSPDKVAELYQKVGLEYRARVVDPSMQESIKAVLAVYTAEELITKREKAREDIEVLLATKLTEHGIILEAINIVDFDFSKSFNDSIEAKVTAEQNALAAKNKLEQVKYEAQQRFAEAEGKAKSMQIESEAIAKNPQILQLRALEKWNGVLPSVIAGNESIPMISIQAEKGK